MALTYTPSGNFTFSLPPFTLPSVAGQVVDTAALTQGARAVLVAFICAHCPYVKAIERRLIELAVEYRSAGLVTIGICSNDATDHPEDAPAALHARWRDLGDPFPYLVDADQTVARVFDAVCTPDFFLFGANRTLVYRGRLDDSWRDPARVTRRELAQAVARTLEGHALEVPPNPSMGCSIKWRS